MNEHEIARRAAEMDDPHQRSVFLDRACGQDAELRRRVEVLLLRKRDTVHDDPASSAPSATTIDAGSGSRSQTARDAGETPFPRQLGHFELLEPLGEGGVGVVYLARDTELNRTVAVKFLRPELQSQRTAVVRFVTEAQITGQLQHPGIPPVHQLGRLADGQPYLVMKLVKGQTLRQLLRQRSDPGEDLGRFVAVFEQVCHAVGYAHAHRVIHRDLKPSNVMVGAHGEVQVMDWGLAKVLDEEPQPPATRAAPPAVEPEPTAIETPVRHGSVTMTGQAVGTPAYMAPEQAGGEVHKLDPRCDVFGLGAILCEILLGHPPYTGQDPHEVLLKAVRGDLQAVFAELDHCGAEAELVRLCKQMLAFDPRQRPPDGNAVAQAVADIRQRAEQRARRAELERAQALAREAEARRRRRLVLGAAAAIILLLAVGIASTGYGLLQAKRQQRIAEAQRALALQHQQEAQRQRQLAEANFRRAAAERDARTQALREAVLALDTTTDRVVEQQLARSALSEENRRFLQRLIRHFQRLAQLSGDDRDSLRIQALGHGRVGSILHLLGEAEPARRSLEQAARLYDRLLEQEPEDETFRRGQARVLNNLAILLAEQGQGAEAEALLQRCVELLQAALKRRPDPGTARELALAWNTLGATLAGARQLDRAEAACRQALRLARKYLGGERQDPQTQDALARLHLSLAMVLLAQGKRDEAHRHLEQSLSMRQELVQREGGNPKYLQGLALAHQRLAYLHRLQGRLEQALQHDLLALETRRRLADLFPHVPDYLFALAASHHQVALVYHRRKQSEPAIRHARQAVALKEQLARRYPQNMRYRRSLATSLVNLAGLHLIYGQLDPADDSFARAQQVLDPLIQQRPEDPALRKTLATCLENRSVLAARRGQSRRQLALRLEAAEHWEHLLRLVPRDAATYKSLLQLLLDAAQGLLEQGDVAAAGRQLRRAASHMQQAQEVLPRAVLTPLEEHHRYLETLLLAAEGKQEEALRRIDAFERARADAPSAYQGARLAAQCAQVVTQAPALPEAQRQEQHRRYVEKAAELLRLAFRRGFPPRQAREDPAFEPLRSSKLIGPLLSSPAKGAEPPREQRPSPPQDSSP